MKFFWYTEGQNLQICFMNELISDDLGSNVSEQSPVANGDEDASSTENDAELANSCSTFSALSLNSENSYDQVLTQLQVSQTF